MLELMPIGWAWRQASHQEALSSPVELYALEGAGRPPDVRPLPTGACQTQQSVMMVWEGSCGQ